MKEIKFRAWDKELNRDYIGIELDENYYNIAYNRINGYIYE